MWVRGYFVSTVGIDEETIRNYIAHQEADEKKEEQLRIWK
jgi:putative transposase